MADATSLVVSFGLVTLLAFGLVLGANVLKTGDRRAAPAVGTPKPAPSIQND